MSLERFLYIALDSSDMLCLPLHCLVPSNFNPILDLPSRYADLPSPGYDRPLSLAVLHAT